MSNYIKYSIQNEEPVRIANDAASQHGETSTLKYIPGTTLRGYLVNSLSGEAGFEEIKKALFSEKTQFLNAYPSGTEGEMIPSPKGFYEDKKMTEEEKEIQNVVVNGEFDEGMKRSGLGDVAVLKGESLLFSSVRTASDLKIKINDEKQDVFRNEYVVPGYTFMGYIRVEDEQLGEALKKALGTEIRIGNARSAGLGRCSVRIQEMEGKLPYQAYAIDADCKNECYFYLASDMAMRSPNGEYCGIDLKKLENAMGVTELEIAYASTSTRRVKGYNRNWYGRIPSVLMYEKGSVFHLKFKGELSLERAERIMDQGIGVRRNEGFGRILFLKGYESIRKKNALELVPVRMSYAAEGPFEADEQTLRVVAVNYLRNLVDERSVDYILEHEKEVLGVSDSQMGIIDSICVQYRYEPQVARRAFANFFGHAQEKEARQNIHKDKGSKKGLRAFVERIMDSGILELLQIKKEIMGLQTDKLLTENEQEMMKLKLISDAIRFQNKREGQ